MFLPSAKAAEIARGIIPRDKQTGLRLTTPWHQERAQLWGAWGWRSGAEPAGAGARGEWQALPLAPAHKPPRTVTFLAR